MKESMERNDRKKIAAQLASRLEEAVGCNLTALYHYGSALTDYFMSQSDFDFLIILKDPSPEALTALRGVVCESELQGLKVDINVQAEYEMPGVRKEVFWHNNRGIYMQHEMSAKEVLLSGVPQFFSPYPDRLSDQIIESVRVASSLVYQTRKMVLNTNLGDREKYVIAKFCIYILTYALAAKGIFPKTHQEATLAFKGAYGECGDPERFLLLKAKSESNISKGDVFDAYLFIQKIDRAIFRHYIENNKKIPAH